MDNKSKYYLEVRNLSYSYDSREIVLNDLTFSCLQGKTIAIVGGSGSGKSTILKLLSSVIACNSEKIKIDKLSPIEYKKTGKLSYMFQESSLLPHLTVTKNISLPIKISKKVDITTVNNLINVVGLNNYKDYLPKILSGGMKTRVALARSFVIAPELLLLDEPFSALDISWKSKLYWELIQLQEQNNTTVVLVTHDIQEAILLSNKVLILSKTGNLIGQESIVSKLVQDRIQDVNEFTASQEYQSCFVRIQKLIMDDGVRNIIGRLDGIIQ